METVTLDGAAALAVAKLKEIKAPVEAKAAEESKAASEAKAKADAEKQKSEGIAKQELEAKIKEDSRIIAEDDTKLSETEKKTKAELLEKKKQEENTPDAKIERIKAESQKRIDEIKSELLAKENKSKEEMAALRAELEEIKKPKQQEDIKTRVKREQVEQIAKYVEEDKAKPKEDRREMSKDELDGWFLEDPVEATAWINRREIRRDREIAKAEEAANHKPAATNEEKLALAKEFARKQNESRAKLGAKYPGAVPTREKIIKIRTDLGLPLDRQLNAEESNKINEALSNDNAEYKLCMEILRDNPKILESTEGPELVMAEIEKRLKVNTEKPNTPKTFTEEEIEAEIARRMKVGGEGISSTHGGKKVETTQKEKSELRQMQERAAKRAGIKIEDLDKSIERRKSIKGADSGER